MIINIFCDASIDLDSKVACGGCYIVKQDCGEFCELGFRRIIQMNATNNSAEILAIWAGINEAIKLRNIYPNAIFRLFSDSKISLYGLRDWMKDWIRRMDDDGVLKSSSGQPVVNQERFIDVYNLIVENNLYIELYHQRGHVKDKHMPLEIARAQFIKANKVSPENMGIDIDRLSMYNDTIDHLTREAVYAYLKDAIILPNTELDGIFPMQFIPRRNMLHQYIRCINKTSVNSRHDFKGGYNQ